MTKVEMVFHDGDRVYVLYHNDKDEEIINKIIDGITLFKSRCG